MINSVISLGDLFITYLYKFISLRYVLEAAWKNNEKDALCWRSKLHGNSHLLKSHTNTLLLLTLEVSRNILVAKTAQHTLTDLSKYEDLQCSCLLVFSGQRS